MTPERYIEVHADGPILNVLFIEDDGRGINEMGAVACANPEWIGDFATRWATKGIRPTKPKIQTQSKTINKHEETN